MNLTTRLAIVRDIALESGKNLVMMFPPARVWRRRSPRTGPDFTQVSRVDLDRFAFSALDMVLDHFPRRSLESATVVEIGPGDSVVLGLCCLAHGATSYHAVDRFLGDVESSSAHRLYQAAAKELPRRYPISAQAVPDPATYPGSLIGTRVFLHRRGIEEYHGLGLSNQADVVFSYAVGQSVRSAKAFAKASFDLLKPGGVAVHHIDLGANGCWTTYSNPLTFLTVPKLFWDWTTSHRGMANRVRFDGWVRLFEAAGFRVRFHFGPFLSQDDVTRIRPYLAREFRDVPTESLRVHGVDFALEKPA